MISILPGTNSMYFNDDQKGNVALSPISIFINYPYVQMQHYPSADSSYLQSSYEAIF